MQPARRTRTTGPLGRARRSLRDFDSILAPYRQPSSQRSWWQLVSTLLLFGMAWFAMYWSLSISYWCTLLLVFPTALLVVRLFIIQHDCGHRSFFKSKGANDRIGSLLGILTFTPYHCWRREHAVHHASSGNLERRGRFGEIKTMTLAEYRNASWRQRLAYRIYRHPLFLFGIAPFFQFVVRQRFASHLPPAWRKERRSVHATNAGLLVCLVLMCWLVGTWQFFAIEIPVMAVAGQIGVWLFYVQHQFEDAFWKNTGDWSYVDAAMAGSSYYRLPRTLQWFTGSIGFHHIHHLDSRIPNYRLQQCHDNNPELQQVPELSLVTSIACVSAKLWDEEAGKMVGFAAALRSAAK